jgi:hypothetical protein
MIPHRVHTMRGPNVGTGTWSGQGSALKIARWWHCQQHTSSDRTPLARMLPRVIGGPAWDRGRGLMSLLGRRDLGIGAAMAASGESCHHR